MNESIDKRVLGAIRLLDRATGSVVTDPMKIHAQDVCIVRNLSNNYIIVSAPWLSLHSDAFKQPPKHPALESIPLRIEVSDPSFKYLPRAFNIRLPRDPDPKNSEDKNSLFRATDVNLYASAGAHIRTNWSTIRVTVIGVKADSADVQLAACLFRVVKESDNKILASGISDSNGEALVIVPGVPITNFAEADDDTNSVVVSEVPVRLEVSYNIGADWPCNMDVLEKNHSRFLRQSINLSLKTGRMERVSVKVDLDNL